MSLRSLSTGSLLKAGLCSIGRFTSLGRPVSGAPYGICALTLTPGALRRQFLGCPERASPAISAVLHFHGKRRRIGRFVACGLDRLGAFVERAASVRERIVSAFIYPAMLAA